MSIMVLVVAATVVQVNTTLLSLLTGSVMPLVTDLVTKEFATSKLKSAVNLVLAVAAGVLSAFVAHQGTLDFNQIGEAAVMAYIASGVTFQMLWKPQGISDAIQSSTPSFGLGAPAAPAVPPTPPAPVPPAG